MSELISKGDAGLYKYSRYLQIVQLYQYRYRLVQKKSYEVHQCVSIPGDGRTVPPKSLA